MLKIGACSRTVLSKLAAMPPGKIGVSDYRDEIKAMSGMVRQSVEGEERHIAGTRMTCNKPEYSGLCWE